MIEILILFFLTRNIGAVALRKGLPAGRWKLYVVLAWIGCEMAGLVISMTIVSNLIVNMIFGLASAFGGYLLVKYKLDQMPDKDKKDDWLEQVGKDENLPS